MRGTTFSINTRQFGLRFIFLFLAIAAFVGFPQAASSEKFDRNFVNNAFHEAGPKYGQCLLRRKPALVRQLVDARWGSKQSKTILEKLQLTDCPFKTEHVAFFEETVRRLDPLMVRGFLFEAMLQADFPQRGGRLAKVETDVIDEPSWPRGAPDRWLMKAGECAITRDPETALAVISANAGSKEEVAALASVASDMRQCNYRARFEHPGMIRGFLAEIFYRRALVSEKRENG